MDYGPKARSALVCLIPTVAVIASFVNIGVGRNGKWTTAYDFSVHAGVAPTDKPLQDKSNASPLRCNATIFNGTDATKNKNDIEKCKLMRSAPMFFMKVENTVVWPFFGKQMTFSLTKHIFFILLAFTSFWCAEEAIAQNHRGAHEHKGKFRIFVLVLVSILTLADWLWDLEKYEAAGTVATCVPFCVIAWLVLLIKYADTYYQWARGEKPPMDAETAQTAIQPAAPQNKHMHEHMHRNIYLSYASLLMFPLVVVLVVLARTHTAIVDVHIQLVLFSFIFYAMLDLFQTRTTAVLLSLKDPSAVADLQLAHEIHFIQFFVVLAFCLCKCFVLLPTLVLLQAQYTQAGKDVAAVLTIAMHHVVLFGFAVADLLRIVFKVWLPDTDLFKLFVMVVYTGVTLFNMLNVDPADKTPT